MRFARALIIAAIIGVVALLIFLFRSRPEIPEPIGEGPEPFGYYVVDGKRGGKLKIDLGDPNAPPAEVEGKDAQSFNLTENDLVYVDPDHREWHAPKGTKNDGASVPPGLQSLVRGGLNGYSRYAAIMHDCYCDLLSGPMPPKGVDYAAVHRMFYYAMRCSHVDRRTAFIMYVAVVKFGPPQDRSVWTRLVAAAGPPSGGESAVFVARLKKWDPTQRVWMEDGALHVAGESTYALLAKAEETVAHASQELAQTQVEAMTSQQSLRALMEAAAMRDRPAWTASEKNSAPAEGSRPFPKSVPRPEATAPKLDSAVEELANQAKRAQEQAKKAEKELELKKSELEVARTRLRSEKIGAEDHQRAEAFRQLLEKIDALPEDQLEFDAAERLLKEAP